MLQAIFKNGIANLRAITSTLHKKELWFLYTARFLIEIYIPMTFGTCTDNFYIFCIMLRTNMKNNCWHYNIYEHDKFHAQMSFALNHFITSGSGLS